MRLDLNLEDIKRTLSLCIKCSMCTYGEWPGNLPLCHMFNDKKFFTYSGGGGVYLARSLVEGLIEPTAAMADVVFRCNTCGNCERICEVLRVPPPHLSPEDVIMLLRAHLVKAGIPPPTALKDAADNVLSTGNPFGIPADRRYSRDENKAQNGVFLHLGCIPAYRDWPLVDLTVKLLGRVGQEVTMIDGESCCGKPLFDAGMWDTLPEIAESNIERVKQSGAGRVVFLCPQCYEIYSRQYPDWISLTPSETPKYMHLTEYLYEILDHLKSHFAKPKKPGVVSFQDPCYLSRIQGKGELIREVITAIPGAELAEMKGKGADAPCCGGGGGVDTAFPEFADRIAASRIGEALSTGAESLVTACPHGKALLRKNCSTASGQFQIIDIVELLMESLA